jgi:hypothetical protein
MKKREREKVAKGNKKETNVSKKDVISYVLD